MTDALVKFKHEAPAAFGSVEELNAIIERMEALLPVALDQSEKNDPIRVKNLHNAYLKAAQLSVFYRLIPGVDVHVIPFGKSYAVDTGVEAWKKAADRYCSLHGITYHAHYEDLSLEELKGRRGKNYDAGDVGVICYLWRSDKTEVYALFGGKEALTKGYGTWAIKARYNSYKKEWEADSIPSQRSKQDVARRRALKAALKAEFSLDSLLAAAPNEVSEQLRWLEKDAKSALIASTPYTPIKPQVTEDGFIVMDSSGTAPQWEEEEDDNGHWQDDGEEPQPQEEEFNDPWAEAPGPVDEAGFKMVGLPLDAEVISKEVGAMRQIAEGLTDSAATLRDWSRSKHADSDGESSLVEYRILSGVLDAIVGKGGHNLLLGVLLGREVHSNNRPGEKLVRFLLSFLQKELPQRDKEGNTVKGSHGRVLKNPNPNFNEKFVQAVEDTWEQISVRGN